MNDLVSIIVPCFNQAQYLDDALQSVLEQSYEYWECIIVNDGSQDTTEDVAKKWIEKDLRFKYLEKENGGLSSARNYGINFARGTYILPLDADDKISSNYVEICINEFANDIDLKVVYGKAIKFGKISKEWKLPSYNFKKLLLGNMIFCTAMYKKEDWQNTSGYDENMKLGFEDWEFWINILKDSGKVKRNLAGTFYYRIHDNNSMTSILNNDKVKKIILRKYIFDKHKLLYTTKTDYDLYVENNNLNDKLFNLHKHISVKTLFLSILKRIKFKLSTI